jgi:hypothetical protein
MMEAVRTSETSVDNHFTRQYNPEDSSELHTRRRENLKSHMSITAFTINVQNVFPHISCAIKTNLYRRFPGRWLGRGSPHHWPPRSPDLSLLYIVICR